MTRWGIMGTGGIATAFVAALRDVPGAVVTAVGSRDINKARRFHSNTVGAQAFIGSYEQLVVNDAVDVVYVATPASHHYRHALSALEAGKHVLVEKPFTVNREQAVEIAHRAEARGLFCMEAMWPRFLPAYIELRRLLDDGAVGEIRMVEAAFGGRAVYDPRATAFRADLAGGTLLHQGCYPIQFAHMILGEPAVQSAVARFAPSGVDTETAAILGFTGGPLASVQSAVLTTLDNSAWVYGIDGMIHVQANHMNPAGIDVHYPGKESLHVDTVPTLDRLAYQAIEVQRCLAEGATGSPSMTLAESCAIMGTMDRVREAIGLRFPDDVEAL